MVQLRAHEWVEENRYRDGDKHTLCKAEQYKARQQKTVREQHAAPDVPGDAVVPLGANAAGYARREVGVQAAQRHSRH